MEFYDVLKKRRTVRDFSTREVSHDVLKKVLAAAFMAPSNDHLRQLEFVVVRGRENIAPLVSTVAKNTRIIQRPHWMPPPARWTRMRMPCFWMHCPSSNGC